MNSFPFSRRRFVQTVSAAGFGALGMPAILRSQSPGKKLNLVIIGCGGRGGANLKEMLDENIVALCDVNAKNLELAATKAPAAKKFRDFRKLFDELKDG